MTKPTYHYRYKWALSTLVEMARVELASESISTKLSPSAAGDFLFRYSNRPSAGCQNSYLVSPLRYRELSQSFPV